MGKTSLRRLFFSYLVYIAIWLIASAVFCWLAFQFLLVQGIILPANYAQTQVPELIRQINQQEEFTQTEIPDLYQYALYDQEGKEIARTISDKDLVKVQTELSKNQPVIGFQKVAEAQQTKFGTLYLTYQLIADFASPSLRAFLPKAERLYTFASILLIVSGFLLLSSHFGKKVNRELKKLIRVTDQIGAMNLAYQHEESKLIELEPVFTALYKLETNLTTALKEQWRLEKENQEVLQALAHDIKTPMTVISGNIELLKETELKEEQQTYLTYAESHLARLNYYVQEVTNLATTNQSQSPNWQQLPVGSLIKKIKELGLSLVNRLEIENQLSFSALEKEINVVEEMLFRGIQNILINGQEYAGEGAKLKLKMIVKANNLVLIFTDNGPGFTKEALERGTEQFYTDQKSRTEGKHYGMGLAIAARSMAEHGGQIILANQLTDGKIEGGMVSLIIPLAE